MMSTMADAADPIGNGAWSLVINTPPIDYSRGSKSYTYSTKKNTRDVR